MKKPIIVIPTNRDPSQFKIFIESWEKHFLGCTIIVIEDREKCYFSSKNYPNLNIFFYNRNHIKKNLGKDSWIIPTHSDGVRSFGYYLAYQSNPLFIVTLDDDVKAVEGCNVIEGHYKNLFGKYNISNEYYNTLTDQLPRGYLRGNTECVVSHGGWLNVPDLDADTFLHEGYTPYSENNFNKGIIPKGCFYSMCGMNLAWKPEYTKYMYFGLQGKDYPIDRCGDIWAGYYSKFHTDILNKSHYTGSPFVEHIKQSNSWTNLSKEKNSKEMSEKFINYIIYKNHTDDDYFNKLKEAYKIWNKLFQ